MPTRFLARLLPVLLAGGLAADAGLARQPGGPARLETGAAAAPPASSGAGFACAADATTLCLHQRRFKVELSWNAAAGQALPLTDDTGTFWFFAAGNPEVVVSVVDGSPRGKSFAVLAAGLTDLRAELTVTDSVTGALKRYALPQGELTSFGDDRAFPAAAAAQTPSGGACDPFCATFSYSILNSVKAPSLQPIPGDTLSFVTPASGATPAPQGYAPCWDFDFKSTCVDSHQTCQQVLPNCDLAASTSKTPSSATHSYMTSGFHNVHLTFINGFDTGAGATSADMTINVVPCNLSVTGPNPMMFGPAGAPVKQPGKIAVTLVNTSKLGCSWSAQATSSWIKMLPQGSFGPNAASFSVSPLTGPSLRQDTITISPGPLHVTIIQTPRKSSSTCVPDSATLCLLDRFEVQASASGQLAVAGAPMDPGWGTFGFADPASALGAADPAASSPRLVIKMLDATSIDGHFWLFAAGLTAIPYTIVVTDLVTGVSKPYSNGAGGFLSQADLTTF
jgi:hypothetical protein